MNKELKYTKGFADAEELFKHLDNQDKAKRRADWLKANGPRSKQGKRPGDKDVEADA